MIYLFIALTVMIFGILIYYFIPILKKFKITKKYNVEKLEKRAYKQNLKEKKQQEKKELLDKKRNHTLNENKKSAETFVDNEKDLDKRVDYNNLEINENFDFFDKESNSDEEEYFNNLNNKNLINSQNSMSNENIIFSADGSIDGDDEEIKDLLAEFNQISFGEKKSIAEDFDELSPEMKALMLSNVLDKKNF